MYTNKNKNNGTQNMKITVNKHFFFFKGEIIVLHIL